MTLDKIDTAKIFEYVTKRRAERKLVNKKQVPTSTAATRKRELAMLSKAFNLARLWNWTKENPVSLATPEDEENGTSVKTRIVIRAWHAAQKKAGIREHLRCHDLRHTFGCRMAEQGCDIHTIATALDHSQLTTTRRYAKHSVESLRRAVDKINNYTQKRAGNEA